MKRLLTAAMVFLLALSIGASASEVGGPIEAAPKAEATRNQTWASVGWCEGARCWLVAWREGYLNEPASDIWCARISADGPLTDSGPQAGSAGRALNPNGIRLTSGAWLKDRPRVASDGKGFLVVWEELRPSADPGQSNEKNWDVYAARISAEGSVLAPGGFLVAGGEHNQCRPDAAFAKGKYFVAWMGFERGGYGIYGRALAPDGTMQGDTPAVVAAFDFDPKKAAYPTQAILPVIAAGGAGAMLSAFFVDNRYLGWRGIDAATGQPAGPIHPPKAPSGRGEAPGTVIAANYKQRTAALAMGPGGALFVSRANGKTQPGRDVSVGLLSETGEVTCIQELGSPLSLNSEYKPIEIRPGAAFDGRNYLVVSDVLCIAGDGKTPRDAAKYARVLGWKVGPDGKAVEADGFAVAGEAGRECLLPAVAAGQEGVCLVVYSEVRGVDDVKVVARTVK